jgi:predicted DNA-binding transcriptional regulator AlpA
MDAIDRLRLLVQVAPSDGTVTVRWLAEILEGEAPAAVAVGTPDVLSLDLTVPEIAAAFGKGPSTIRTWLAAGAFPGAYRLHNREWRIPRGAVAALQRREAERHRAALAPRSRPTRATDTSEWRQHLKKAS